MKRYLSYIASIFSFKKILYKDVSILSYWDKSSSFTNNTRLGPFVRVLNSSVGKYTRISKGCSIVYSRIGNFCSISSNVQIGAGRHPINYLSTNQIFYNKNKITNQWVKSIDFQQNRPIEIGNDVWIGTDCLIMGGVTIGDGAIIGAKSLVTKNIPPFAIAAGTPAKIIRFRFPPEIIDRLLEIKWWNLSDKEITEKIELFRIPELTLEEIEKYFPKK